MHALLLLAISAASALASAQAWPKLPDCHRPTLHKPNAGFVTAHKHHLYLGKRLYDFRSFNYPGFAVDKKFEITDALRSLAAFASPVTRSYTLTVTSIYTTAEQAYIQAYDHKKGRWIFNEKKFRDLDFAFAEAARFGVKVIFPIINADYGDNSTDWSGNYNDLVMLRYNISDYATAQKQVNFFTDPIMRKEYKAIIKHLLTRRNTVNGRVYGHDDAVLAWQTGNELNYGPYNNLTNAAPPGAWTVDIAKYLKQLAPKTLVMDGTFSRTASAATAWAEKALKSPYVDLFGYHWYGEGDIAMGPSMIEKVQSYGKTFIVDEYGFFSNASVYVALNQSPEAKEIAGMLVWSLRPHSSNGGFLVHDEGSGQYSFHIPGWKTPRAPLFMADEDTVVHGIYEGSYKLVHKKTAPYPVPVAPIPKVIVNATTSGFTFLGSSWAEHYELWAANIAELEFGIVSKSIYDNVDDGTLFIPLDPSNSTMPIVQPRMKPVKVPSSLPVWHDTKWSFKRELHQRLAARAQSQTIQDVSPAEGGILKRGKQSLGAGTWYALRGVNPSGVPGPFSKPFLLKARRH